MSEFIARAKGARPMETNQRNLDHAVEMDIEVPTMTGPRLVADVVVPTVEAAPVEPVIVAEPKKIAPLKQLCLSLCRPLRKMTAKLLISQPAKRLRPRFWLR